jgi:hypothetical protein
MAVPASHALTSYLDNYDRDLNDALKRADGVIAVFGKKGRIKEETGGGPNFKTRIMYGQNPNTSWGSTTGQVTTAATEAKTMATVPQKFIRGAISLNIVELSRAAKQSEWALGDYVKEEKQLAMETYVQKWADALRADAPGANDPYTLLPTAANVGNGILAPQAKASQTATTAQISRADNDWWRNAYSNTSIDISTEAGRSLLQQLYLETVFGSTKNDEPDFGLTNALVISDLTQFANTNKRGDLADKLMLELGLSGIMFENAMLIRDSATKLNNKVCFLNTRDLYIKFLRMNTQGVGEAGSTENWDENNEMGSIPVSVFPFQRDIDSFHFVSLHGAVASLVPAQLRTHALADNVV